MKNLDFLPEIYRQQHRQRAARRWWCAVAAVFAASISVAAGSQWWIRRGIERELADVESKFAEALKRNVEFARLQEEIVRAEEVAELYTYLAHPWPRTQLLAALVRPLPDSMRLTELSITFEMLPAEAPPSRAGEKGMPPAAKPEPSLAVKDLQTLRQECDQRQTVISLAGVADDVNELHGYVEQLGKSPLFAAAHLKGVESAAQGSEAGHSRFLVHVVVKPGYGQPRGPHPRDFPAASSVAPADVQLAGGGTGP
jgi:Tfp pilus assembly protein PilN